MNILFFFPKLNSYNNFKPLINLVNFLISKGHNIYIAVDNTVNDDPYFGLSDKVNFLYKNKAISKTKWVCSLLNEDMDVFIGVQAHNGFWLVIGRALSFNYTKKIISWEHSSPFTSLRHEYKKTWLLWLFIRIFFAKFTDAFFCVSYGAVSEMSYFYSKRKAKYSPNIIFSNEDLKKNDFKKTVEDKLTFISVGRLSEEKGLILSLEAMAKIKKIDYRYLIVGDGPCYKDLEKYVMSNSVLCNRVFFLGRRDDVLPLMSGSDVLLLPSYFEGLPTVMIEASIVGLPIIASDCKTGPAEIIKEGVNGYLFKVGDVDDLYFKIKLWLKNKEYINNNESFVSDYNESAGDVFLINVNEVLNDK